MRFIDFIYFIRQIFFPGWKPKEESEIDRQPNCWEIGFAVVLEKLRSKESAGVAVSLGLHAAVLLALSWFFLPIPKKWEGIEILGSTLPPRSETKEIAVIPGSLVPMPEDKPQESDAPEKPKTEEIVVVKQTEPNPIELPEDPAPDLGEVADDGERPVGGTPERKTGELVDGGGYEGRTKLGRGRSVGVGDSSSQGENAVEMALAWLAAHQNKKDGGWHFDFAESCRQCGESGTHGSRIAATALALLPFLGAGYTHETGPYRTVVEDGLHFLLVRAVKTRRGAELNQGTEGMYSHGIATIALCEAYAMSRRKPKLLGETAQDAIHFIENAQNENDGGWRYVPNSPMGDLSVTAWQVMALKSGKLAGLHVRQAVIYDASLFLDDVSWNGGREYKYLPDFDRRGSGPDSPKTCNATGLLLRMYLGWEPGERMLDEGIDMVAEAGPLKDNGTQCNLYYAYYATLALHHHDGSNWRRWNTAIREFLVQTQSRRGHEAGSWYFPDEYCDKGGRLLNTALAAMILETPYRIMPLFRKPGDPLVLPRIVEGETE